MIKSVRITNYVGELVEIVLTDDKPTHGLLIKKIDGLGPSAYTISSDAYGVIQGSYIKNTRVDKKNIVITFLLSNAVCTIEEARKNIYKYFPLGRDVKFEITTDSGLFEINGVTESNEPDIFSQEESAVVSIICPKPFFVKTKNPGKADDYSVDIDPPSTGNIVTIANDTTEPVPVSAEILMNDSPIRYTTTYVEAVKTMSNAGTGIKVDIDYMKSIIPNLSEYGFSLGDKFVIRHSDGAVEAKFYKISSYDFDDPWNSSEWYPPYDVSGGVSYDSQLGGENDLTLDPGSTTGFYMVIGGPYTVSGMRIFYQLGGGIIGKEIFEHGDLIFDYNGDIETGGIFEIQINTDIDSYEELIIRDDQNHSMTVNLVYALEMVNGSSTPIGETYPLLAGDKIVLSSVDGNKKVSYIRNNTETNILDACGTVEYDWPRIYYGSNHLTCTGLDSTKITATLMYEELHGGV